MIGPILLLASWLLLRMQGKGLGELGFNAPLLRTRQFLIGFAITAIAATIQQLGFAYTQGTHWILDPGFTHARLMSIIHFNVNSVLYEELVFRGYLLYQAIRLIGTRRAILLDAAAFGIYHWFSYQAFGNPVAMAFIFLFTGSFGLMFATAFCATKSLALPIGLHLGWNTATMVLFSSGPLGAALLIAANGAQRIQVRGGPGMLFKFALPLALVAGVCWYLTRKRPAAPEAATLPPAQAERY